MDRKILLLGFVVLAASLLLCQLNVEAVVLDEKDPRGKTEGAETPKYAPGEIIIKFKSKAEGVKAEIQQKDNLKIVGNSIKTLPYLPDKLKVIVKDDTILEPVFKGLHRRMKLEKKTEETLNKESFEKLSKKRSLPVKEPKNYNLANVYVLKNIDTKGKSIEEICEELKKDPNIEYAEPNYKMELYDEPLPSVPYIPNDYYIQGNSGYWRQGSWGQPFPDMYGMRNTQTIEAHSLCDTNHNGTFDDGEVKPGEGIVVAVIDSGIDYNHEDLHQNIWVNPGEVTDRNGDGLIDIYDIDADRNGKISQEELSAVCNGMDDGYNGRPPNGYIDDVIGYDIADGDNKPSDYFGHGTHVAGTIAAVSNNSVGVMGLAPYARIMPVKGFPAFFDNILAEAIYYAADNGAQVLSNSWGPQSRSPSNSTIELAIDYAYDNFGCVIVFAAGNADDDVKYYSPNNYPKVISVAAADDEDQKAYFSNWGDTIDVAAPGVDVLSLRGKLTDIYGDGLHLVPQGDPAAKYYRASGTSMACPHVAGLAALIMSKNRSLNNEEMRALIRSGSDDLGEPGRDERFGYGRINGYWSYLMEGSNFLFSIISPASGSYVRGNIDITGNTVMGDLFQKYELYYAPEDNPQDAVLIASSTTPVQNGLLGTWDTTLSPDGKYLLYLRIFTTQGMGRNYYTSVVVDNYNQPPAFDITDKAAVIGRVLEFKVMANEPDDPNTPDGKLEYNALDLPPGAVFNPQTQILHWLPTEAEKGIHLVTFTARDNEYAITKSIVLTTVKIEEMPVTEYPGLEEDPDIYGGKIIWRDSSDDYGIGMYDISTGIKSKIPDATSVFDPPHIWGDRIVWLKGFSDVYMYDIANGQSTKITTDADAGLKEFPFIHEDKIIWVYSKDYPNQEIYLFDLSNASKRKITTGACAYYPSLYGDNVVWADMRKDESGVYMHSLSTGRETRINTDPQYGYSASIYENIIVWDNRSQTTNWTVYMYDILSDKKTMLSDSNAHSPVIYDDKVVWEDRRYGNGDIYMFDISTGLEVQITVDAGDQDEPDIYQNRVAWRDDRNMAIGSSFDIYMAQVFFAPQITAVNTTAVSPGSVVTISGTNFGYNEGDSSVQFENGAVCNIESWSNNEIACVVPQNAKTGLLMVETPGGKSNGIYIEIRDTTPPTVPIVTASGIWNGRYSKLTASWSSSDDESGIAEYQYKVTEGSVNGRIIRDWTSSGTNTSMTISGPMLRHDLLYYVSVKARNGAGLWSDIGYSEGIRLNRPPKAIIVAQPNAGFSPLTVRFYGNRSFDLDGKISSYLWDFGNGTKSTATNPIHRYTLRSASPENYNASLTVKDDKGLSDTAKTVIRVIPYRGRR